MNLSETHPEWILASDIDNTLTGDEQALERLAQRLRTLREEGRLFLILSTGRRLVQVLDGFEQEGLPEGDAIISQVGTEIYLPPFEADMAPLQAWKERLEAEFSRQEAESFLDGIEGLRMQPDKYNTPLKVSCYLDEAPEPEAAAREIERRVRTAGKEDVYQVIWSSGRDLDIIPAAAGKGKAIRFLLSFLDLESGQVIVAGDSGNDRTMFEEFDYGIIVANAQPELKALPESEADSHYRAGEDYAAGVIEGLRHFGIFPD
ncbi:MAG: HAD-IIB family hydrolase [Candidatus Promineifilaceae bacterium]|nr:HAD-IIB family hydrolase [Candidatus Promineifilaceae bacterium]